MMKEPSEYVSGLDAFELMNAEAAGLDTYFAMLRAQEWERPSRCEGWSVADVLRHLAGEELYNHACLNDDLEGFYEMVREEAGGGGLDAFNQWCIEERRALPPADVLREWREQSTWTRARMSEMGADAMMTTSAGPYPVGLQAFHFASEFATHADDVGVPHAAEEADRRSLWRVSVGLFALAERGEQIQAEQSAEQIWVYCDGAEAGLSHHDFVEATVGRLAPGHPLPPRLRSALRCLA
jgi:uncharacterized protein (TIGR03083 family)